MSPAKNHFLLGRGSDLLVSDAGYRGVIIALECLMGVSVEDDEMVLPGRRRPARVLRDGLRAGLLAWSLPAASRAPLAAPAT